MTKRPPQSSESAKKKKAQYEEIELRNLCENNEPIEEQPNQDTESASESASDGSRGNSPGEERRSPTVPPASEVSHQKSEPPLPEGDIIMFNKRGEPYQEFNYTYPAPITIDGNRFDSCEHYLLFQEYAGTKIEKEIPKCQDAKSARKLCNSVQPKYNWEENRDAAMKTALNAKFEKYDEHRELLLRTEPKELVFHNKDTYWGDGVDGGGQNQLGKLLMELRSEFKQPRND